MNEHAITTEKTPTTGEKKAINLLRIIQKHGEFHEVSELACVVGRVDASRLRIAMNRGRGPYSEPQSLLSDLHAPLVWLYNRFGMSFQVRDDGLCLVFFRAEDHRRMMGSGMALPGGES